MDLNLMTPINQLGYGIAGLNICKSLSKMCNVSLFPMGPVDLAIREDVQPLQEAAMRSQKLNFDAPCLKIWHQHDLAQFVGRGLRIGFPFFELDVFKDMEKHHLNNLDALFVASEWAKKICLNNLTLPEEKIFVVPLGVNSDIFSPAKDSTDNKTIFFNCGKWEVRKGHDVLVELFNFSFNEEDDVELWLMCSNPFLSPEQTTEWERLYKTSKLGNKIKILPRAKTQVEVYNTMSKVDCGIFPSRAEGWNLELLELMSCGKNVIATNYSAHTEFCNKENCFLVDIDETEAAYDGKWFLGDGNWAKISDKAFKSFVNHMKNVHEMKQSHSLEKNNNGIQTAERFSWDESARKILHHVQLISE